MGCHTSHTRTAASRPRAAERAPPHRIRLSGRPPGSFSSARAAAASRSRSESHSRGARHHCGVARRLGGREARERRPRRGRWRQSTLACRCGRCGRGADSASYRHPLRACPASPHCPPARHPSRVGRRPRTQAATSSQYAVWCAFACRPAHQLHFPTNSYAQHERAARATSREKSATERPKFNASIISRPKSRSGRPASAPPYARRRR